MAATRFVHLRSMGIVRSSIFVVSIASMMAFIFVFVNYLMEYSFWFFLGVVPFVMSFFVCYAGFLKRQNMYFIDYASGVVSIVFCVFYLVMYWEMEYSSETDAQGDIAWFFVIPLHFFIYLFSCVASAFIYYVYSKVVVK